MSRWHHSYKSYKAREREENVKHRRKQRKLGVIEALAVNGIRVRQA